MTTHFSILSWKIPWTEEPDGLQSIGSQKTQTATKQVICIQQVNFESLGLKRIKCKKAIECSQVNMVH